MNGPMSKPCWTTTLGTCSRDFKRDIEKKGLEVATEEYRARVAYCIPILSRSSINIDVSVSQTPEMLAQDKPPGINLAGKTLDGRQCIVVRIEEENQVANASAVLVETLRQRARVASERFGPQTEESLFQTRRCTA